MPKPPLPLITGGRIAYRRTIQPQPYETKSAEVEFAFTVEPSDHPADVAAEALELARDEVHKALGIRKERKS